jgi:hypothetical protein
MTWGEASATTFYWSVYDEREYTGTATAISSISSLSSLAAGATTEVKCAEACIKHPTTSCYGYVFVATGTVCKLITDGNAGSFGFSSMKRASGVKTAKLFLPAN